jgi:hypothetical protein
MESPANSAAMSSDLIWLTNEPDKSLRERFDVLLGNDTRKVILASYLFNPPLRSPA